MFSSNSTTTCLIGVAVRPRPQCWASSCWLAGPDELAEQPAMSSPAAATAETAASGPRDHRPVLVAGEDQPLVEVAVDVHAEVVVVGPPQDAVRVGLGRARVGQPDVRGQRYRTAGRVLSVVRHVELAVTVKWRAGVPAPAEDVLL